MSEEQREAECRAIDSILSGIGVWHEFSVSVKNSELDSGSFFVQSTVMAFDYHFPHKEDPESPFSSMLMFDGKRYPPDITAVDNEIIDNWIFAFNNIDHPLLVSRIGDLIWVNGRTPGSHIYAQRACRAYAELANADGFSIYQSDCIVRAIDIAVKLNMKDITDLIDQAVFYVKEHFRLSSGAPGIPLRVLDRLSSLPKKISKKMGFSVYPLLGEAERLYVNDAFILEHIRDLMISSLRGQDEEIKKVAKSQIQSWVAEADRSTPLVKISHLKRAQELANSHGLSDDVQNIRLKIQNAMDEPDGMTDIYSEVRFSSEEYEASVENFINDSNLHSTLIGIGSYCPIPEKEQVEIEARDLIRQHPLRSLIKNVIVDDAGLPKKFIQGEESYFLHEVKQQEIIWTQMWGAFLPGILNRVADRFDSYPSSLEDFFVSDFISPEIAKIIARGFSYFHEEKYDEALCIVTPRLEAVIREMCRQVGISVYIPPVGENLGEYKALGVLLSLLEEVLPQRIRTYISLVLNDQVGINIRNRLCHGHIVEENQLEVALILHMALLLRCFRLER
ncbi:DUF4209 domain-containing protein [Salinactinospora qingdaonensis]|uniref:DUF4209 domain-containing protein n=1 Tax=Salinactinospora qingdaonensis TaxID=702744 RepID=A0ABP7GFZ9_9ACTN